MDVRMFGPVGAMTVPEAASVVRDLNVGDRLRVITDVSAVVREIEAFARLSGNAVRTVEETRVMTVDMQSGNDDADFFAPVPGSAHASGPRWVVVLEVLPTNKLIKRS
ncbi:sulfurtransferase TusA family protein [Sulfobacillus harzensis]|uniref:Uncharacterized protein n=1 Tax=Sulfobacillus harzensis TaxID=2729629 RepID=A0A7Y0Q1B3_9FIRM|nr:sulfurtransferase TusA family protein [Sulfobacillus harzensis]NMP21918.1 hypothetical protein [Sulfobacillus harzensis]